MQVSSNPLTSPGTSSFCLASKYSSQKVLINSTPLSGFDNDSSSWPSSQAPLVRIKSQKATCSSMNSCMPRTMRLRTSAGSVVASEKSEESSCEYSEVLSPEFSEKASSESGSKYPKTVSRVPRTSSSGVECAISHNSVCWTYVLMTLKLAWSQRTDDSASRP
jgi:hypothetical protein